MPTNITAATRICKSIKKDGYTCVGCIYATTGDAGMGIRSLSNEAIYLIKIASTGTSATATARYLHVKN